MDMDFSDLSLDIAYEAVGLAFDVVSVLSFDEDAHGFWLLFGFFLIYPMVIAFLQEACSCCATESLNFRLEIVLTMVKTVIYMYFSSFSTVIPFIGLGAAASILAHAKYKKAQSAPPPAGDETVADQVASKGAGVINFCVGCCCGNVLAIYQSIFMMLFTFFPEDSPFRTNEFDIVGTVMLWASGYTVAHVGDMMMLTGQSYMAAWQGDGDKSTASYFKLRVMSTIEYLGWACSLFIVYLCGQFIYEGTGTFQQNAFCWLYAMSGFVAVAKLMEGLCCGICSTICVWCIPRKSQESEAKDDAMNIELGTAEAS